MSNQRNWQNIFLFSVFGFALFYSLWTATIGWWNPILDQHSFRQTQTAITSYFMFKGGPFWKYETPLFGPPWSIPFEFPLYQWLVAILAKHSSIPLEQSGRVVGRFFYYAALWPIFSVLGSLKIPPIRRLIFFSLYLVSPLYLYWSRTFLMESTALFFSIWYLACVGKLYSGNNRTISLVAIAIVGALAGILKVTTFAGFLAAAGFWFLNDIGREEWLRLPKISRHRITEIFALAIFPVAITLAWTHFSDYEKELNPIAHFISSGQLSHWNFGTLEQRLSGKIWYMFFRKTIHDSIGHRTTWMISVFFMLLLRKRWKLYLVGTFLFFLVPMVFTNLHIQHNYYWYANGIFLVFALGAGVLGMFEGTKLWQSLGAIFFIVAIALSIRQYQNFFRYSQLQDQSGFVSEAKIIQAQIPEDGVVLFYGWDWYPALPYYLHRRVIMNRENLSLQSKEMQTILASLAPYRVTHLALCNGIGNAAMLAKLEAEGLIMKHLLNSICDFYSVQSIKQPK